MQAWRSYLLGHSRLVRELNAQLIKEHGLTFSDYDVLIRLSHAPERRMRRVDLAGSVLISPSGITRLLEGLERCGYVERAECETDRRVVYAVLTDSGVEKLSDARASHLTDVQRLFADRYSDGELESLGELLARLSAGSEAGDRGQEE